jgi:hypothetical protein
MKLSSLLVAVLLILSQVVFAQHSSGGGSSSGGSSSSSSSSGASHSSYSGGSSSSSYSSSSHSSSSASATSHSSGSAFRGSTAGSAARPQSEKNARVEDHNAAVSSKNPQPAHRGLIVFLRHPFRKPAPQPAEADRRRPVCKGKTCRCPPGETAGKNGECVVSVATNNLCRRGRYWDTAACSPAYRCLPNQYWDGAFCIAAGDDCATIEARALANELRAIDGQIQTACSNNRSAPDCSELTQSHEGARQRYQMLWNQAASGCRTRLLDPLSL